MSEEPQATTVPNRGTTPSARILYSMGETAQMLGISIKLLRRHVEAREIRFVLLGKRTRKFTQGDIDEFIGRRQRKWASSTNLDRRSGTTTSAAEVEDFGAALKRRLRERRRK